MHLFFLCSSLWRYGRDQRPKIVLYLSLASLAMLAQLALPLVMAELMSAIQHLQAAELAQRATHLAGAYAALGVLFWMLHGPSRVLECQVAFEVKRSFQLSLLKKVTELPMKWHRDHHSGQIIDQIAKASGSLSEFAECGFEVLHLVARFVGSLAILGYLMPKAAVAMLAVTLLVVVSIRLFDRSLIVQYDQLNIGNNLVAAAIQDYLTNISTVISLRLEQRVCGEVAGRIDAMRPLFGRNIVLNEWKWFTTSRLIDFCQVGLLLLLILQAEKLEVGQVYAVSEYLRSLGEVFFNVTWKYGQLVMQSTKVSAVEPILETHRQLVPSQGPDALASGWAEIEIGHLEFSHHPSAVGLHIPHLKLQRGRSYALVGPSGSGKSTFLSLLRGLHQPEEHPQVQSGGKTLMGGLSCLYACTTLIPQDPEIFANTISFNLSLGLACPQEQMRRALRLSQFDAVVERLPQGIETDIAEKGISLSGGERQRLALARGIFFEEQLQSSILLLDEPTSSVDPVTEAKIYRELLQEFKEHCVISSLHKLHLLELFDEVIEFRAGTIVFQGPVQSYRVPI